jgi:aspartyl/asparaginyl-tRNA synthetase
MAFHLHHNSYAHHHLASPHPLHPSTPPSRPPPSSASQVIAVLHDVFTNIFDGLETRYAPELATIRAQYPSDVPTWTAKPCILHWEEANALLLEAGEEAPGMDDLSTVQERALGRLVKEKHGTDFFFLDRFPAAVTHDLT